MNLDCLKECNVSIFGRIDCYEGNHYLSYNWAIQPSFILLAGLLNQVWWKGVLSNTYFHYFEHLYWINLCFSDTIVIESFCFLIMFSVVYFTEWRKISVRMMSMGYDLCHHAQTRDPIILSFLLKMKERYLLMIFFRNEPRLKLIFGPRKQCLHQI